MSAESPGRKAVVQCTSDLTSLLKHNLSCSGKLLEKGLITEAVHNYVLTAQGISAQEKAARLVSCLADRVGASSQVFHQMIEALKETDPFCGDIVDKLTSLHSSFNALRITTEGENKQVGSTIKRLEKQFSSLQRRLSSELNANGEVSPEILLESLTLLPIALRNEYEKIIFENLSTLEKANSIRKLFHHLNPLSSFIDYHLVEYLVEEFGSEQLQEDMSAYVKLVQVFYDETTVQQLMDHWPGRRDIPPHFEELRAVIDEDPGTYTLRRLDNLRKEFCSEIRLFETVLILKRFGRKNSFVVCWVVPSIFVPQSKSVISSLRSFYQREHIFSVTVGRQRLYSIAAEYEERLLLLCSSGTGDISEFQYLLSQPGLDTNIYDKNSGTPLYWLSADGRTEVIQLVLEHGAEVDLPNDDAVGDTPLRVACKAGHVAAAALLIEKGADINNRIKSGVHALYSASFEGKLEIVKLLLDHDAQIDLPANDDCGFTALGTACSFGHVHVARLLIERGAAIDYQATIGKKPVVCGQSVSVQDHDSTTKKFVHITPLLKACSKGHTHTASLLIEAGADINYQDEDGWTPLIASSDTGRKDTVELLIEKKARLNIHTKEGWTALSLASWRGHTKIVEVLVQAGADVNIQGQAGLTALMLATQNGHAEVVKTLLDGKADPNITDETSGWTAIFFAAKKGDAEIARQLIGGRDMKDKNGVGPLDVARVHGHQDVCDLLQQYSNTEREKEITKDQKEQVKETSQRLMSIFSFLEHTLLRGRVEKREKKKVQERESSNIQETREQREVAVEAVQ